MILFRLLALPVTGPVAGLKFVIDRVAEFAEQQLTDDQPVREELLELHLALEEGRVTEEEYSQREASLFARLREIREYRRLAARERLEASAPEEGEERTVVIDVAEELK